jgi:hypothetical protein
MKFLPLQQLWLGLMLTVAFNLPIFSQATSGNITGTIYDQTGAAVPGATIVAHNTETGIETTVTVTSAGVYRFENLFVGTYGLTVTAPGFGKAEVGNVNVQLNQTVTTNIKLEVGQATTSVQVTESAVAIDTTTAQIQSTFEAKQIADLPVTAGTSGVLNLSLLAPGVATSGSVGVGTGPTVGGQRPRNNNFTIEGIDNNRGDITGPAIYLPNDSVAEFSMLQNQYSPDFGHSSGGQFNQVVKSGTNQFHGAAYEYFQNRNLNAADNLYAVSDTPLHPRFDNNRFGGNFGGPIKRNKLFFFGDYEYNPVGQAGSAGLIFAPTTAGYNAISADPQVNQTNFNIMKQYLGTAPTAAAPGDTPNGAYPLLSTKAAGAAYNQATVSGAPIEIGQISVATPNYFNQEYGVGSVDYNISDRDALRGRFILNRNGYIDASANLPVFFTTQPQNSYIATLSEYHNFSPTLINELRLGYNKFSNDYPVGNQAFPGLDQFPNLQFWDLGGVQLGPDPNAPQYTHQNIYQLTDNVTWTKGAHSFKMGFDGQRNISPQSFTQRSRGDYEYNFLSDYLLDFTPDFISQRSAGNPIYWGNRWMFGWYANDQWKVRPNLTLNLGLRYEYQTVPAGEMLQSLNAVASVPGLITFGEPQAQRNNIMPRIGIAYSPGTSGKTSIRAGFGINYDVLFDNLGLLTLPPQLSTTQDNTGDGGSNFLASGGLPPTGPGANFTPAEARASTGGFVPNVQRPKSYQWNFGIQHEFASHYVFETRYLGTRGTDLDVQNQLDRQPVVNASNALPLFWSMPSQATLNSLPNTLDAINAAYGGGGNIVPAYAAAGFESIITSYQPWGNSIYHGWANQLTRRFSNGLQFMGAYTWSHAIDDSTADVFSTYTSPRRPQDSQNLRIERASSALDHRNRITLEMLYDVPYFKHSNWFMKNLVGNWEIAPIYTYQTGTLWTPQSGLDSNLNGDSAPDRAVINPNGGNPGVGSDASPLTNSVGQTVAYLVDNPNAQYAVAPKGTLSNGGRNTEHFAPINDIDITVAKRFNFTERVALEFSARAFNVFNHPQYAGGYLNDVQPTLAPTGAQHNVLLPSNSIFADPSQAYSSNPRQMILALKLIF